MTNSNCSNQQNQVTQNGQKCHVGLQTGVNELQKPADGLSFQFNRPEGLNNQDQILTIICLDNFKVVCCRDTEKDAWQNMRNRILHQQIILAKDLPLVKFILTWCIKRYTEQIASAEKLSISEREILMPFYRGKIESIKRTLNKL